MKALLAEFASPAAMVASARQAREQGFPLLDALTPYRLSSLDGLIGMPRPPLRGAMALAGFGMAALMFGMEWWTSVHAYPTNAGGRPLFSWPVFLLVPFEVGVLAAGIAGFVAFLFGCGFPRLNHPVFDVPNVERASQDRFFLLLDPLDREAGERLQRLLFSGGALAISETST